MIPSGATVQYTCEAGDTHFGTVKCVKRCVTNGQQFAVVKTDSGVREIPVERVKELDE